MTEVSEPGFGTFLQDVAARVIQHHYFQWKGRTEEKPVQGQTSSAMALVNSSSSPVSVLEVSPSSSVQNENETLRQRALNSLGVSTTELEVEEEEVEVEPSVGAREVVRESMRRSTLKRSISLPTRIKGEGPDDERCDSEPRRCTPQQIPQEVQVHVLREQNRNVLRESFPGRGSDMNLHQSTDKLQDILQFLKEADSSMDASRLTEDSRAVTVPTTPGTRTSQSGRLFAFPDTTTGLETSPVAGNTGTRTDSGLDVDVDLDLGCSFLSEEADLEPERQNDAISAMCNGVQNKIKDLNSKIHSQIESLTLLERQVEEGKKREKKLEADFLTRITQALEKQGKEHEVSLKRHLNFIDRILKDKDQLSRKCEKLAEELKSLEEMYNKKIDRLQSQWAIELKKQKEVWQSAEKARREAWLSEKTREIKELTIKGLEPEIQRLIQKNKSDLEDLEAKHNMETRKKVEECKDYYESYMHSLRDQWRREKDDLIEHERATASSRLREQGDRYDSQMESLRMRLVSDFESKLSTVETLKREECTRNENTVMRLNKEQAAEVAKLKESFEERLKAMDRNHDNEKERMREKFETEQEGWRQMIVKKIKEEYDQKEEEMMASVAKERNAELEVIVTRLEEETQMMREKQVREFEEREKEIKKKHFEQVKELKEENLKFSERYREAAQSSQSSEMELSSLQSLNKASARELEVQGETIAHLEKQLAASRRETEEREKEIREMYQDKLDIMEQKVVSYSQKAEKTEGQLEDAKSEIERINAKNKKDMFAVESRVKEAITKREGVISHLQNQLLSLQQTLED